MKTKVNRNISESVNICQSAPSGDPWRETLLSHTPFPTVCSRSLETFDKISRQSNQELLAEEKNFLPRANNQVLGGREGDFYPEKGEKDLMGREEGILLSAQLSRRWKKVSFLCNLYSSAIQGSSAPKPPTDIEKCRGKQCFLLRNIMARKRDQDKGCWW